MSNTPPPIPAMPLPYQTPVGLGPLAGEANILRKGSLLVVPTLAILPNQCVKCAQPGDGKPITKAFYWHPPLLTLMIIFPGLLIYAIVALCVRKKATLTFSLCPLHRRKKLINTLITTALCLSGVGLFVGTAFVHSRGPAPIFMLLGGIVLLLLSLIWGMVTIPPLRPSRIDNHFGWFKGCSSDFLSQFSSVQ